MLDSDNKKIILFTDVCKWHNRWQVRYILFETFLPFKGNYSIMEYVMVTIFSVIVDRKEYCLHICDLLWQNGTSHTRQVADCPNPEWKASFDWRSNTGCIPVQWHILEKFMNLKYRSRWLSLTINILQYGWPVLNVKTAPCLMRLVPCFATAGHICTDMKQ